MAATLLILAATACGSPSSPASQSATATPSASSTVASTQARPTTSVPTTEASAEWPVRDAAAFCTDVATNVELPSNSLPDPDEFNAAFMSLFQVMLRGVPADMVDDGLALGAAMSAYAQNLPNDPDSRIAASEAYLDAITALANACTAAGTPIWQ